MRQVDFWAMGVVLYQFLIGETPFYHADAQEQFRRILGLQWAIAPSIPPLIAFDCS